MKKIVFLSIFFLSFLGFTSCTKEEIQPYEDTSNIYFSPAVFGENNLLNTITDTTVVSFGFDVPSITQKYYLLPIRVQGKISNVDRNVKLVVDPSSTAVEGVNFILPEKVMIRANRYVDTIAVKLLRTPDIKTKNLTILLNLEENESFTTKMDHRIINTLTQKQLSFTHFKITFNDQLSQPKGWFAPWFGVFSLKKFYLMCDLMSLDPLVFNQNPGSGPGLGTADMQYYQNFMKRYLADQKASGNTIYEADGTTEMFFP